MSKTGEVTESLHPILHQTTNYQTLKSTIMQLKNKFDFSVLILAFALAMLLMATSCSNYGSRCLRPGELQGAGRTHFNK